MKNKKYDKLYVVATVCHFKGELLINVDGVFADEGEAKRVCESLVCNEKLTDVYKNGHAKSKIYELYKDRTKKFSYVSMNEVMMNAITNKPFESFESFFSDRRDSKLDTNKGELEK